MKTDMNFRFRRNLVIAGLIFSFLCAGGCSQPGKSSRLYFTKTPSLKLGITTQCFVESVPMSLENARKFVDFAQVKYPDLQAAVLLVGGWTGGNIKDTRKSDLDKMINLNFYTAYNVVRPLLAHFLNRPEGGQFILIGSRPGMDAASGMDSFAYAMSKSLIFKLADFINAEGKNKMVSATVIVPSVIDTEANRKAMPGSDFTKWVPAESIADAISFSLSDTGKMLRDPVLKIYNRS